MRHRSSLPTRRALVLAAVAALAVSAAVASSRSREAGTAAATKRPATPAAEQQRSRCTTRTTAARDRAAAELVAPTTTVHLSRPLRVTPPLGSSRYVFPLPGPYPPFADTFGAPRADTGWHHGDDLFAPRETPVLAVADGTVFSVGWNRIGGWRLWLRDRNGNLFYYAHLQRYSRLAINGRRVQAGSALGYVGASGDAVNTPPHLFFEINPASLRHLGYDGTVDPTNYLRRWTELPRPTPADRNAPPTATATHTCRAARRR